jgi:hypothetical protein
MTVEPPPDPASKAPPAPSLAQLLVAALKTTLMGALLVAAAFGLYHLLKPLL